jgi:hypothetical protein
MFDHPDYDHYTPETLPLGYDIYLRDEKFMAEYDQAFLEAVAGKEWRHVGYVSFVAARLVTKYTIELSWFYNINDRFHEVSLSLPRDQIVRCLGIHKWDEKPSIFVKSAWLEGMHRRVNCIFGFIDAIGVRGALGSGLQISERLPALRARLDKIASANPQIAFLSFADSVILKTNWTTGFWKTEKLPYNPEQFLHVFGEIRTTFRDVLGLNVFGVFTQGSNEYVDSPVLHISETQNHVCLNSLGAPFADLLTIEMSAKRALREGTHAAFELYLDETFYHSLHRKLHHQVLKEREFIYDTAIVKRESHYVCTSLDELMNQPPIWLPSAS